MGYFNTGLVTLYLSSLLLEPTFKVPTVEVELHATRIALTTFLYSVEKQWWVAFQFRRSSLIEFNPNLSLRF